MRTPRHVENPPPSLRSAVSLWLSHRTPPHPLPLCQKLAPIFVVCYDAANTFWDRSGSHSCISHAFSDGLSGGFELTLPQEPLHEPHTLRQALVLQRCSPLWGECVIALAIEADRGNVDSDSDDGDDDDDESSPDKKAEGEAETPEGGEGKSGAGLSISEQYEWCQQEQDPEGSELGVALWHDTFLGTCSLPLAVQPCVRPCLGLLAALRLAWHPVQRSLRGLTLCLAMVAQGIRTRQTSSMQYGAFFEYGRGHARCASVHEA